MPGSDLGRARPICAIADLHYPGAMSTSSVAVDCPSSVYAALDPLTTAVAIFDPHGGFRYANPAFVDLTGVARWRGCAVDVLGASVAADLRAWFHRARTSRAPLTRREYDWNTREPALCVDVSVGPLSDDDLLLELHARLPSEVETTLPLSHSLRGLAHEVKNPLAGLRGAAQLLCRRLRDAELMPFVELILAEADRLTALADRLLRPAGKPTLRPLNLHEVAERARALLVAELAPEVRLSRDYDPSLPMLNGDADRLLQLLLNLLRNAHQAGATTIGLRTRAESGLMLGGRRVRRAVRLDVIDNGSGVAEELRESLFLPLVSGRADGTGLGLALAQEIAHEHGGRIVYRSRPGHTVFSVLLPLDSEHA
jgi:two-component system nitrogen regulation sensor histidine kinase GlnL